MKKLILILLLASCRNSQSLHEVQYSPDNTDSVAYVWYYDGQQHYTFHMPYEQFKALYDEGGYESVYDYYREHELPEHFKKKYEAYRVKYPYKP